MPKVEAIEELDRFTPHERVKREVAEQRSQWRERRQARRELGDRQWGSRDRAWEERMGLEGEQTVRTDAVISVYSESDDGLWRARWVLAEIDDSLVVRALHLEPTGRATPIGGVSANLLRELRPTSAIAAAASLLGSSPDPDAPAPSDERLRDLFIRFARREVQTSAVEVSEARRSPGRPQLSDDHLAAVAEAYIEELRGGPGVLRRLGQRFERPPQTMRDHVRIARRRGFLSPASKSGSKGGVRGPALLAYQQRNDHDPERENR